MFCSNCGSEIEKKYKFCPKCGEKIDINNEEVKPKRGRKKKIVEEVTTVELDSEDNSLDTYWNNLLNRVNGQAPNGLWNKFNSEGRAINTQFGNRTLNNGELQSSKFKSVNLKTTTWFRTI